MSARPYDQVLAVIGRQKVLVEVGAVMSVQKVLGELAGVSQSTVSGWAETGIIPLRHWPTILKNARQRGIDLKPEHLAPTIAAE